MAAVDTFALYLDSLDSPAENAAAVTPNDGADLTTATRYVYIGGAGAMKVDMVGGQTVTFTGLLAGNVYRLRVTRIYATGTTVTNIVALW